MMGFILVELGEWRTKLMQRTIFIAAIALGLTALIGPLHPLSLSLVTTAIFIVAGWAEGCDYLSSDDSRRRMLAFPITAGRMGAAKVLASFSICFLLFLALSPLMAASAIAWGLSLWALASLLVSWLCAFFLAASAGFFSSIAMERSRGFVGLFMVVVWILVSFIVDWMRPANPFLQAWRIMGFAQDTSVYLGMAAEFALSTLLIASTLPSIARAKRSLDA
jgi:hypothetical protein